MILKKFLMTLSTLFLIISPNAFAETVTIGDVEMGDDVKSAAFEQVKKKQPTTVSKGWADLQRRALAPRGEAVHAWRRCAWPGPCRPWTTTSGRTGTATGTS